MAGITLPRVGTKGEEGTEDDGQWPPALGGR